jgi:hypothetical protein
MKFGCSPLVMRYGAATKIRRGSQRVAGVRTSNVIVDQIRRNKTSARTPGYLLGVAPAAFSFSSTETTPITKRVSGLTMRTVLSSALTTW